MICGIILAAGDSLRMGGRPKALLKYKDKTFLETIIGNMRSAGIYDITVVLGKHSEAIQSAWPGNCERAVVNPNPENGQISSLCIALNAMPEYAKGAVLALVDQPLVSVGVYEDLVSQATKNSGSIIIPVYKGKRGHPIFLSKEVWPLCHQVPPNTGLHWVVHHPEAKVMNLEVNDETVIRDIDTPEDYKKHIGD